MIMNQNQSKLSADSFEPACYDFHLIPFVCEECLQAVQFYLSTEIHTIVESSTFTVTVYDRGAAECKGQTEPDERVDVLLRECQNQLRQFEYLKAFNQRGQRHGHPAMAEGDSGLNLPPIKGF